MRCAVCSMRWTVSMYVFLSLSLSLFVSMSGATRFRFNSKNAVFLSKTETFNIKCVFAYNISIPLDKTVVSSSHLAIALAVDSRSHTHSHYSLTTLKYHCHTLEHSSRCSCQCVFVHASNVCETVLQLSSHNTQLSSTFRVKRKVSIFYYWKELTRRF